MTTIGNGIASASAFPNGGTCLRVSSPSTNQPIIVGMVTDPKPGHLLSIDLSEGAVMISHPHRPDLALEALES